MYDRENDMNVYLFRHGEVENPKHVLYGRLPGFCLSEIGCEHVRQSAKRLVGKGIKKIYSSPLERAIQTSKIVADVIGLREDDIIIDDRLIESDVTKWQGTPLEEYKKKVVFGMSPKTQKEIEPITHAGDRVLEVMNSVILQAGENAVVVSHGDPLVGVLINLTGDWSILEAGNIDRRYIQKGEYIRLSLNNEVWEVEEYSY